MIHHGGKRLVRASWLGLAACLLLVMMAALPAQAQQGAVDFLRKLDRDVCRNFESVRCRHKAGKPARAKAPSAKKVAPAEDAAPQQAAVSPKPLPVLKPDAPMQSAAAEEAPSAAPPIPVLKPARGPEASPGKQAMVLPRLKPEGFRKGRSSNTLAPEDAEPVPPPSAEAQSGATQVVVRVPGVKPVAKPSLPGPSEKNASACLAGLKAAGVVFQQVASPAAMLSACSVATPVKLLSVRAGAVTVEFPDQPTLNCAFALRFTDWLRERGQPLATQVGGSPLVQFYTGPGFQCRGRNGDNSGKISEHGYGNAVDIERLVLADKRVLWAKEAGQPSAAGFPVLNALRKSGCERFTTVLGPGANAAHAAHFHFDLGRHGRSGTYVICE